MDVSRKRSGRGRAPADPQLGLFGPERPESNGGISAETPDDGNGPTIVVSVNNNHAPSARRRKGVKETAQSLASRQREISISEFFTKNRHLLGFDNPAKALLTATKEAVDNSLDACEEAGILPDIKIGIRQLDEERFRISVTDNGPGIVKAQIPKIFGKLLYGSKFHRLKQSRGQQGIGISAAGMYGYLTSGKPVRVVSKIESGEQGSLMEIVIDTRKNTPTVLREEPAEFEGKSGTSVEIELEGVYRKGKRSVDDYIAQTALANPHAQIEYVSPKAERSFYPRISMTAPRETFEIKPHPHGTELGMLMRMMRETKARNLRSFLGQDFSRIGPRTADEILRDAGLDGGRSPKNQTSSGMESLYRALARAKLMNPPTDCLAPIGEEMLLGALQKFCKADFYTTLTRKPSVYRGNPFLVEVALAYGGALGADEGIDLFRLANRVPLLYQQAACAISKGIMSIDWKPYGLQQSRQAMPVGPMALIVHIASVWVPFTSESKEAIAHYPEIVREMRLALMECGRRLHGFVRKRRRDLDEKQKRMYIEKYIPHIGIALKNILDLSDAEETRVVTVLTDALERSRTRTG